MRMPHWPIPPWNSDQKYDLENIAALLELLGSPHLFLPPVIHVAGTNGKGSSCAMLRSIFEAASYKVHCYTSPHLIEFNERIVVASEQISDQYLFEICERTRIASLKLKTQAKFFESVTAASFLAFAENKADILILETGMGGRLDPTNVIAKPQVTLITSISYDHMEYLGRSLPLIAGEKSGIIKWHVPCVISCQVPEVYDLLLDRCAALESPALCYEYDFAITQHDANCFEYSSRDFTHKFPTPSLLGDHQLINAAAVIASLSTFSDIAPHHIAHGLQNTKWRARIEKIHKAKYSHLISDKVSIWVDGAHNSGGAQALANWIRYNLTDPTYMIIGMTKNRNVYDFCSYFCNEPQICNIVQGAYAVKVLSEANSYGAQDLATQIASTGLNVIATSSLADAILDIGVVVESYTSANIVICGSLFLASDFFKTIEIY